MSIQDFVARAAQIHPNGAAVVDGQSSLSWSEVELRVSRIALALRDRGLQPGSRVGVLAANGANQLLVSYALSWGGFVYVPLNTRLSAAEQQYILRHSATGVLITDAKYRERGASIAAQAQLAAPIDLDALCMKARGGQDESKLVATERHVGSPSDTAVIFYTGGTTGVPKGVDVSHGALTTQAVDALCDGAYDPETVWLHVAPMFHMADFVTSLAVTVAAGGHAFLAEFSPKGVLDSIEHFGANTMAMVPTMMAALLDGAAFREVLLQKIRTICYGAAPVSDALLRRMLHSLPQVRLIQCYGQTEAVGACTTLMPEHHVLSGALAGKLGTAGRATPTYSVRVVDSNGLEVPRGEVGEVAVSGPGLMTGYWNDPELTSQVLRNGWLHTGDMGQMTTEGFLTIVGRIKDMIISGGENVFAGEVENALVSHLAIQEAAVIGVPNEKWGESVHAVVVLKGGATLTEEEVIAHCRELVAAYKCPRTVEFRSGALPLSGVGKVRKVDLLEDWRRAGFKERLQ